MIIIMIIIYNNSVQFTCYQWAAIGNEKFNLKMNKSWNEWNEMKFSETKSFV